MTSHERSSPLTSLLPSLLNFSVLSLKKILPYVDCLVGNEAETDAWASANGLPDPRGLPTVAKVPTQQPKPNPTRIRVVIFTHGDQSTIAVSSSSPGNVKMYAVNAPKDKEIVDANGTGDVFEGGLVGGLAVGRLLDEAIEAVTLWVLCVLRRWNRSTSGRR